VQNKHREVKEGLSVVERLKESKKIEDVRAMVGEVSIKGPERIKEVEEVIGGVEKVLRLGEHNLLEEDEKRFEQGFFEEEKRDKRVMIKPKSSKLQQVSQTPFMEDAGSIFDRLCSQNQIGGDHEPVPYEQEPEIQQPEIHENLQLINTEAAKAKAYNPYQVD